MSFWILFGCCFAFVVWLDDKVRNANAVKRIRAAGKR